ncbi:MAG: beta-lactamase family protein [Alphaproteobacteria bacterium]|nr:serine hydrolase [Rhizobiaceae bacterium]MBU3962275.1 beta-lactamase family protein [Alphaproteobacteria bacterium]MBU4049069.1 beta-lactamase family protein [Alphaproteobacteria bacterium]MBU4089529.1 beta-lactamase family protein [Alphaproteobacteria bacterium]MBU4156929.1 beta-lactamase family protein [Alphaproteobacteria bacterium]
MTTEFKTTYGFERRDVTIANWRTAPYSRWSFQNLREMVPTTEIRAAAEEPETALVTSPLLDAALETGLAGTANARAFLDHAHTDAFVLMKGGQIVAEHYAPHTHVNARHIVFSVSKSLTALVSAVLQDQGVIDPDCPVVSLIPEAKGSAYGDCSFRDVLDMRVSLDFDEAYLTKDGAFARYRRSTLWNPAEPGAPVETLTEFLMTLQKADRPHGGPFFYASPNSDLLGILVERASGRRYADLFSDLLWKPLGAKNHALVSVDGAGTARSAGGVCLTARDLARVGQMLLDGGTANGRQVVPAAWVTDMQTAGDPKAWAASQPTMLANGRYRSKWYQTGEPDGAFCAIGIHGQWLYVDPSTETVIVKLSSQPNPLDDELKQDNFAFFRALSRIAA